MDVYNTSTHDVALVRI